MKIEKKNLLLQNKLSQTRTIDTLKGFFSNEYQQITTKVNANLEEKRMPIMIQTDLAMKDFHLKFWELSFSKKEAANWINLQMLWRKIQNIEQLLSKNIFKSK
jgi:hypothetical protein